MSERNPALLLGTYELTGKQRSGSGKFIELRFKNIDASPNVLDAKNFESGGATVIVLTDKTLAKGIQDEEVFRIWMERVE